MSQPYPFIIQGANITVVIGSTPFTISKSHITYPQVLEAIKAGDWDRVKEIVDPVKVVLKFGQGNVSIEGEQLSWKGKPLHTSLATRMISMLQEGFDVTPMVNFMENLMSNPSKRAVDELYGFLEKNNLPITPDGHFLAYKRVRANYFDCHSGTMDNSVGKIVEMERNDVDDNKDNTCSSGLHFCSHSYLGYFGGDRVVIVKINPRDVVSIPSDYNDAKGRACRYEVIGEIDNNPEDEVEFTKPVQTNANSVITEDTWEWDADGIEDDFDDELQFEDCDLDLDNDGAIADSSIYNRGYEDGFTGADYSPLATTQAEYKEYDDGYEDGSTDAMFDNPQQYRYVAPAPVAPNDTAPKAAWPFPKGDK